MKPRILLVLFLSVQAAMFGQNANTSQIDQVILKLKNADASLNPTSSDQKSTGNTKIDAVSQNFHALKTKKQLTGKQTGQCIYVIKFPEGTDISKVVDEYNKTGELQYAEPDYKGSVHGVQAVSPNDVNYSSQWGLKNDGTFTVSSGFVANAFPAVAGADIDMEDAWTLEQGDSSIIVAIIDTGDKLDHPDFAGRIWRNYHENGSNSTDDDANGYINDVKGWDFVNSDNDPSDDQGHGTNVASIIGANGNNSIGLAGVDWHCKLMILKGANSSGVGQYSDWANAITYAVDNGAKVINMSMGGTSASTTLTDAVNYATAHNVVVVASMGDANSATANYPAAIPGVIAVGGTNPNDTRCAPFFYGAASGSAYGNHISVVAPGNYIYGLDYQSNTNITDYCGTSQAAPIVTGLSALLLAQKPTRTPAEIKSIIEATAEDQVGKPTEDVAGWDKFYGHGRVNAFHALSYIFNGVDALNKPDHHLLVYPNPSSGTIHIVLPDASNATCKIVNAIGQIVYTCNVKSKTMEIDEKLIPGIYFVFIESNNKIESQKIIVK